MRHQSHGFKITWLLNPNKHSLYVDSSMLTANADMSDWLATWWLCRAPINFYRAKQS